MKAETVRVKINAEQPVEESLILTQAWNSYSGSFKEIQLKVSSSREMERALIRNKVHLSRILLVLSVILSSGNNNTSYEPADNTVGCLCFSTFFEGIHPYPTTERLAYSPNTLRYWLMAGGRRACWVREMWLLGLDHLGMPPKWYLLSVCRAE